MVKFFLLALLVTGLLIGGKVEVWLFPFPFFPSSFFVFRFSLFCVFCVLGCMRYRESRGENEVWFLGREESLLEKKKKKGKKEKSLDVRMSGLLRKKIYFFSSKWRRGQEGFRIRTTTTLVCYFKGRERQNVCWKTQYFGIENDGN